MDDDKPFGWRPFTEEHKQELRDSGFSNVQISEMEAGNVYHPLPYAIQALELAAAIMETLTDRFGGEFAADIQARLRKRADELATADDVESRVEAPIVQELAEFAMWDRLKAREDQV